MHLDKQKLSAFFHSSADVADRKQEFRKYRFAKSVSCTHGTSGLPTTWLVTNTGVCKALWTLGIGCERKKKFVCLQL